MPKFNAMMLFVIYWLKLEEIDRYHIKKRQLHSVLTSLKASFALTATDQ